jgi:hypothetical protein
MKYRYEKSKNVFCLPKMAKIALDNNLWIEDWSLFDTLVSYSKGSVNEKTKMALAYHDYEVIGFSIEKPNLANNMHISVFVKEEYRLKGIGKELALMVKGNNPRYSEGIEGSLIFWKKVL